MTADLPTGAEVTLTLVDMADELDEAERAALREEIRHSLDEASLDEASLGETVSGDESLERLDARRGRGEAAGRDRAEPARVAAPEDAPGEPGTSD